MPCVDDVGSCTYDDGCALLSQIKCPPEFKKYGIPCQCPIKAVSTILQYIFNMNILKVISVVIKQ